MPRLRRNRSPRRNTSRRMRAGATDRFNVKFDRLINKLLDAVDLYARRMRNGMPNLTAAEANRLESMIRNLQTGMYTEQDLETYNIIVDTFLMDLRTLPDQVPDSPLTRAMLDASYQRTAPFRSPTLSLTSRRTSPRSSPRLPMPPGIARTSPGSSGLSTNNQLTVEIPPSALFSNTSRRMSFSSM